jgi:ATP-dependent Lon protease
MGADGVETFVTTPELKGAEGIGSDPLPPGQVWGISPGGPDEGAALYRIEVNEAAGSGVRITNVSAPGPLKESIQTAYQNLLTNNRDLVGDRDARQHELNIQVRAMDIAKSGSSLGLPILLAFSSALLAKSLKGGLILVGGLSVGGSFETIHNAIMIVELAVEKGAETIMLPVTTRRQLNDLSDEMAAKINIVYYIDIRDALIKALLG